ATVTAPTTTYVDNTVSYPTTYYYVVRAISALGSSVNSNEASCTPLQPPVTASPNTGLQTNENGATATFTISFNQAAPAGGSTVTVTSSNTAEGVVSIPSVTTTPVAGGVSFNVPAGFTGSVQVIVTGVDDNLVDGPIAYQVNVTASGVAVPIPPVQL